MRVPPREPRSPDQSLWWGRQRQFVAAWLRRRSQGALQDRSAFTAKHRPRLLRRACAVTNDHSLTRSNTGRGSAMYRARFWNAAFAAVPASLGGLAGSGLLPRTLSARWEHVK